VLYFNLIRIGEQRKMNVQFYQKPRGDYPVKNYINKLDNNKLKLKIWEDLNTLKECGHQQLIKAGAATNLRGYPNLYELITDHQKIYSRIFFSILEDTIWLWHGFTKKTNHTPLKDINKALSYKKNQEDKLKLTKKQ